VLFVVVSHPWVAPMAIENLVHFVVFHFSKTFIKSHQPVIISKDPKGSNLSIALGETGGIGK